MPGTDNLVINQFKSPWCPTVYRLCCPPMGIWTVERQGTLKGKKHVVGCAVASYTRILQSESSHEQNFIMNKFTVYWWKDKNKE